MVDQLPPIKTLELDKICRVCLTVKKDMRPLFGEMIAELLMECARIQVDDTDGWPDKICIQCVHQVSRCHAFKSRVEKSDQQLRQYIKGITVIVEEPITQIEIPQQIHRNEIQLNRTDNAHHHGQVQSQPQQQQQQPQHLHQRQEIQITRQDLVPAPQMIITNGHLHNAQIINAGQIVSNPQGQQMIQTNTQNVQSGTQNVQLHLVQTGNGTVQMIQQNGQPAQLLQIQRTGDDRCEIIVQQPDVHGETQYYTEDDLKNLVTVTTQLHQEEVESSDDVQMIEQIEHIETEIEEEEIEEENVFTLDLTDDSECEDKEYLAEFISMQTSCPYPGRFICNLCRKEFKNVRWLNTHMKSHSNWIKANCKKQPQCNICGRSFKGPGMLKMHMKTHEKPPEQIPTCKVCNKEFKSKTILYRHRQTHLEKNIRCGVCQKSFTTISQLQSHQQKLNHEKIYICSHCNKQFTNTNEFKVHLQLHNNKAKRNDLSTVD